VVDRGTDPCTETGGQFYGGLLGSDPDECKGGCSYKMDVWWRCGPLLDYFGHLYMFLYLSCSMSSESGFVETLWRSVFCWRLRFADFDVLLFHSTSA